MKEIRLEEIDSTNSYAKSRIDDFADKTVIFARRQTFGRGRLNRVWVDLGEGNLFMSIVLKPSNVLKDFYSNLTQYLSVCLCKVLEKYELRPQIKWPNDVLIAGKKIGGILSEAITNSGGNLRGIILGIGVNLNVKPCDVSKVSDKAITSLNLEIQKTVNVDEFRQKLLDEFFENYEKFLAQGFRFIKDDYILRNCFIGKELSVKVFDKVENGVAKSIDDYGELVLTKNDKDLVLTIGDIL